MNHTMNHPTSILLVLSLASACSGDTVEPPALAEFAELCGQAGPVQLLALDPSRPLATVKDRGMFGQRRVIEVGYLGGPDTFGMPPIESRAVWSVGACGEDPLLLGEGEVYMQPHVDLWPENFLLCDEDQPGISIVDPSGVRPSNEVFAAENCSFNFPTKEGLLRVVPAGAAWKLVLQPWPDDPWTMKAESITLFDSVLFDSLPSSTDDDSLVLTSEHALVSISRVDASLTTIATDVDRFSVDHSGRYLAWQSTAIMGDDSGPIFLDDRATGVITQLAEGQLHPGALGFASHGILEVEVSPDVYRIYWLPSLESIDLPSGSSIGSAIDDKRLLLTGPDVQMLDVETATWTTLFDGDGTTRVREGAVYVVDVVEGDKIGPLWRIAFDGGPTPELVAERADVDYRFTPDGRVLTLLDAGEGLVGSLTVVDPDTLEEQRISTDTLRWLPTSFDTIEGDPLVLYARTDAEHFGVWLARLDTP